MIKSLLAILFFVLTLSACASSGGGASSHKITTKTLASSTKMEPSLYFEVNNFNIKDASVIDQHAKWLKSHPESVMILAGFCDERGNQEFNLELGDRRARAVMKALMDKGISEKQLIIVSFGKDRPAYDPTPTSSWSKNRRVDFIIR